MTTNLIATSPPEINVEMQGLARLLRDVKSANNGTIEPETYLDVAQALDQLGTLFRQAVSLEETVRPNVAAPILSADTVMTVLNLEKLGHASIITALANRRGRIVSREELAETCGYTISSLPVVISHIRTALNARRLPISIQALYRRGYRMSIEAAEYIEMQINAAPQKPVVSDRHMDDALQLFLKLKAPACLEDIFLTLCNHVGEVVTYNDLSKAHDLSHASIHVYTCRLRNALKKVGHANLIENIPSLGYRVRPDVYQALHKQLL